MRRDVVITGAGAVTAMGVGAQALWDGLVAGRCALSRPVNLDPTEFGCCVMGIIPDDPKGQPFEAKDYVPKSYRKAVKVMARDSEIAVACAKLGVDDARLATRGTDSATPTYPPERSGCQIGAGLLTSEVQELASALATAVSASPTQEMLKRGGFDYRQWGTIANEPGQPVGGMNNLQPLWMLKYLPNMLACHVTIIHGAEGPSNTITCAEASGLLSIGESTRVIERGDADLCFSGSAESKVNLPGLARSFAAGRLARLQEWPAPSELFAPYTSTSRGSIQSEGGGIVILEWADTARARNASVYARIAGFGAGHALWRKVPPYPLPEPDEVNKGLVRAIRAALNDAGISPEQVDAIIPQACGSAPMDVTEANALRAVFGDRVAQIPCVLLSPYIGDVFAGTGGVQAVVASLMIRHQTLPGCGVLLPTRPNQNPTPAPAGKRKLENVLACGASVGGQNAAVVFQKVT